MMREAFSVGVVLMAKDMYSSFVAKAQRDITQLGRVSKVQADEFSRSLAKWQKFGAVGLGITAVSTKVAGVFEDMVRQAGQSESSISRAFIQMGGSAGVSREKLAKFFSQQQTQWGNMSAEVSSAIGSAGGRLGDYAKGVDLVGVAATLSAARQLDLATSTDLIATLYQQYGKTITGVTTDVDKFRVIASETSAAIRAAGGDPGELAAFMENVGVKAAGAGQSLETVLGLFGVLRGSGMGTRATLGIMQLFDKMSESRQNPEQFAAWYPTTARTGNVVDFLGEIQKRLVTLGATDARSQFDLLNQVFGESAPVINYLLGSMDKLTAETGRQAGAAKDLASTEREAKDQMSTWDGIIRKLAGSERELIEVMGAQALPVVKAFDKALGSMITWATKSPAFARLMGTLVLPVGLAAEAGKIAGPIMLGVSALGTYRLNQQLSLILQQKLTAETGRTTIAAGGLRSSFVGVLGVLGEITAIGLAAYFGVQIGKTIDELTGFGKFFQKWMGQTFGLGEADTTKEGDLTEYRGGKPIPGTATALGLAGQSVLMRLKKGEAVPIVEQFAELQHLRRIGGPESPHTFALRMAKLGFSPTAIYAPNEPRLSSAEINAQKDYRAGLVGSMFGFASGGPVHRTGLALVHQGEYVLPRHAARSGTGGVSVVVNLSMNATGNLDYDVRALARAIIRVLPGELKAQARRYA